MQSFWFVFLSLSILIGFMCIFFTSFGTAIILFGAIVYAWATGFTMLTLKHVGVLIVLYLVGEVIEFFATLLGAKKFGASNKAAVGAMIGGFLGVFLGSPLLGVGLFFGTLIGIFLGALFVELWQHRDLMRSIKAGTGGVLGRLGAIIAKVIIAIMMIAVMLKAIWL